jgi:hypothetical protein
MCNASMARSDPHQMRGSGILGSSHNSHPIHIFTHYTALQSQLKRRS